VEWAPIIERLGERDPSKPVRPRGTITVRWGDESLEVAASMVVRGRKARR
jgi:hypothetical protein